MGPSVAATWTENAKRSGARLKRRENSSLEDGRAHVAQVDREGCALILADVAGEDWQRVDVHFLERRAEHARSRDGSAGCADGLLWSSLPGIRHNCSRHAILNGYGALWRSVDTFTTLHL
jgi:hypothetical protein